MHYRSEMAEQLGSVLGDDALCSLCAAWPGVPVYVPLQVSDDHPLVLAIGLDPAKRLSADFGGCTIIPPRLAAMAREGRNETIRRERTGGMSAAQLARKYKMHIRQIWNVLSGETEQNPNLSFDF